MKTHMLMENEDAGKTYGTKTADGESMQHSHIGAALMHLAKKAEPMGNHMHVHGAPEGERHTTHHVKTGEAVKGPHNHEMVGHMTMHAAKHMGDGDSDHMHVEATDDGVTTHHVIGGGVVRGPDEHESLEAAGDHMEDTL